QATATYSDTVVFSGPGSDPIGVSLNLNFDGALFSNNVLRATLDASASIAGVSIGSVFLTTQDGLLSICDNAFGGFDCAMPLDAINTTLTTSSILVPVNTPVTISLSFFVADSIVFNQFGEALFLDTFGLVGGGPVFNLPDGFTANVGDYLVNNRFISQGPTPVPEPTTLALVGVGIVLKARRSYNRLRAMLCKNVSRR